MIQYPKIDTIFKRDPTTKFKTLLEGEFSRPEFEYLQDNKWIFTEKVDGTNIRIIWDNGDVIVPDGMVSYKGRTDDAQMPTFLLGRLQELFTVDKFRYLYPDISMTLYGEGYGAKIQKGGGNYKPDGVDFVLFDVRIGETWLERSNIEDIAGKLGIDVVPIIGKNTLSDAIELARWGFRSHWGEFDAEGIVLRPEVELLDRRRRRIITKIKHKDFPKGEK
jgi:ATP-dependent RNA circularization protein (DNA/RNA ligase family)